MRLIRVVVSGVSIVLAVVLGLFVSQMVTGMQTRAPLHTTSTLSITTSTSSVPKEQLITSLDSLVDQHKVTLIKVTADPNNYENKTDIFWFGTQTPPVGDPSINGTSIQWFANLTGDFLPASQLGNRPLSGTFKVSKSPDFDQALNQWATTNSVTLSRSPDRTIGELTLAAAYNSGTGNATISVGILLVSTLVFWFFKQARPRSLRLLGGIPRTRIHLEDIWNLATHVSISMLVGAVGIVVYTGFANGWEQIPLYSGALIKLLIPVLIVVVILIGVLSLLTRPTVSAIAHRQIPLRAFRNMGSVVRFIAIAFSIMVLPLIVMMAQYFLSASQGQSAWEGLHGTVRANLSGSTAKLMDTDKGQAQAQAFFDDAQKKDILTLSYAVDKGSQMDEKTLGGYDHLIITNDKFLKSVGIGIGETGKYGKLTRASLSDVDPILQEFISDEFSVWSTSAEALSQNVKFYTYTGSGMPAGGQDVGHSPDGTFIATHPLVAVVNSPASTLKTDGFLVPAMSRGNVLFTDADELRSLLAQHGLTPYISGIDQIADLALNTAQQLKSEASTYVLAAILIIFALVVSSLQGAQLWAAVNEKRVFTLHSSGRFYRNIIRGPLSTELVLVAAACLCGAICAILFKAVDVPLVFASMLGVFILYSVCAFVAFKMAAKQAFSQVTHRNY